MVGYTAAHNSLLPTSMAQKARLFTFSLIIPAFFGNFARLNKYKLKRDIL